MCNMRCCMRDGAGRRSGRLRTADLRLGLYAASNHVVDGRECFRFPGADAALCRRFLAPPPCASACLDIVAVR